MPGQLTGSGGNVRYGIVGRGRLTQVSGSTLRAVTAAAVAVSAVVAIGTAATGGGSAPTGLITSVTTVAPDVTAAAVLAAARTHLGQKYVYGGEGPTTWDCSGLTSTLWRTLGGVADIPRTARDQQAWAIPVPAGQVLPGDLYFLGTPASHVGLVIGAGWVLDASASSGKVVLRRLWTATNITFGRVRRAGAVPVTGTPVTVPPPPPAPPAPPTAAPAPPAPPTPPPTTAPVPTTPVVTPRSDGSPLGPMTGRKLSVAVRTLVGARYQAGGDGPAYDDGDLVAAAWSRAGGGLLPLDRNALAARTKAVPATKLALGDLVIYGTSLVWHVGVYVGKGTMVDSSRINGRVVLRKVFTSPDLHYGRFPLS